MEPIELSFLTAVGIAGLGYLLAQYLSQHISLLKKYYIPQPILGGLLLALLFLLLRLAGLEVTFPTSGRPADFLIGLLTTNMGLHITPKVLREEFELSLLFLGGLVLLYFVQLLLVSPAAIFGPEWLPSAVMFGPLSFAGAPFNLNPPQQVPPIAELFRPAFSNPDQLAKGIMMLGVLAGAVLGGVVGRRFFQRAGEEPPRPSPEEKPLNMPVWDFTTQTVALVILILNIISLAFLLQGVLQRRFDWFQEGYLPVILIAYFLGALFRVLYETLLPKPKFPKKALNVLLFGPTMGIAITYAVMSIPLANLRFLTLPMVVGGLLAITGSVLVAWLLYPLLARFTKPYYAAAIATIFLVVTTGWGPMGMAYLRRFTDQEGPVEPMPIILPINALFLFPWVVIFLTQLVL